MSDSLIWSGWRLPPVRYIAPVDRTRRHLGRLNWIALVAILSLALAPTLSRAIAHAQGVVSWGSVCTASPSVPFGDGGDPTRAAGAAQLEHCPLCAVGAAPFAPPAGAQTLSFDGRLGHALPGARAGEVRARAWFVARPRGPPAVFA
jgi:hypothetical protein